jgi:5-methylcytosine-specific restriction endonuclease McrA
VSGSGAAPRPQAVCMRCARRRAGRESDPLGWHLRLVVRETRTRARARRVPFDLTEQGLRAQWERVGGRCELCGSPMEYARDDERRRTATLFIAHPFNISPDQRVAGAGYTHANLQLVHVRCNLAKSNMVQEEFLAMCRRVAARHPAPAPPG